MATKDTKIRFEAETTDKDTNMATDVHTPQEFAGNTSGAMTVPVKVHEVSESCFCVVIRPGPSGPRMLGIGRLFTGYL